MGKEKNDLKFLMIFFISNKNGMKIVIKWFINKIFTNVWHKMND